MMSNNPRYSLIFFVHSDPKGSEKNQFTSTGDKVDKLIFDRYTINGQNSSSILKFIIILFLVFLNSCIVQFVPQIEEEKEVLVVQGLITDQHETDTIKLSESLALGQLDKPKPVTGYNVTISDNLGNMVFLSDTAPGTYLTPSTFQGVIGRFYTLHVSSNAGRGSLNYESNPMEMKPVPPIDSIYYTKTVIEPAIGFSKGVDGCQIYLDTHDPSGDCRFFRWDFAETWILRLLFPVQNQTCWISDKSHSINIKSTAALNESRITRLPVTYITNITDRLSRKYSILLNQYSLNEDEYQYWEKIQNVAVQVGGLYDVIPASVQSNMKCIEDPTEKVLGYFSVSAKSSKRLFIKDNFEGIIYRYGDCVTDTIGYVDPPGLGVTVWILEDEPHWTPPFKVLTDKKGCADCTVRGSNGKPGFWEDK
jgi:Domain of unknown function (DUF4249)